MFYKYVCVYYVFNAGILHPPCWYCQVTYDLSCDAAIYNSSPVDSSPKIEPA